MKHILAMAISVTVGLILGKTPAQAAIICFLLCMLLSLCSM